MDNIGTMTFDETAPYKFSDDPKYGSKKYRKGVVSVLTWVSNLATYYIEQIKLLESEFEEQIAKKKHALQTLQKGDFRNGIMDGFKKVEELIDFLRQKE